MQPPEPTSEVPALPIRPDDAHKGSVGRVAVIAGSRGMSGAAALAGLGALRGGAGLVRVLCVGSIQPLVAGCDPCLMTVGLPETRAGRIDSRRWADLLDETLGWATVVALGPGLGQDNDVQAVVADVFDRCELPLVVDADGLNNAAARGPQLWQTRAGRVTIMTPHPGEMRRLRRSLGMDEAAGSDEVERVRTAHEVAAATGAVVLLKGHRTVVCDAARAYVNTSGNPGMATGGMGDVLTGLIAALLGQGMDGFDAARLGAYCHGLAGDLCVTRVGPIGFTANDVAQALPAALARVYGGRMGFR